MKAADVMVSAVISVRPNARVEEVAGMLLANRGVPHLRCACARCRRLRGGADVQTHLDPY
jgi:hypothetical protein